MSETIGQFYARILTEEYIPDGWFSLFKEMNASEKEYIAKHLVLEKQIFQRAGFFARLRYAFTGRLK